MSRECHLLLICDVTDPTSSAGHTENTAWSTVTGAYCVYRAVAWQRVDRRRYNIEISESDILLSSQSQIPHSEIRFCLLHSADYCVLLVHSTDHSRRAV
jgi:hypothetical protein